MFLSLEEDFFYDLFFILVCSNRLEVGFSVIAGNDLQLFDIFFVS